MREPEQQPERPDVEPRGDGGTQRRLDRRHLFHLGAAGLGAMALAACAGPTVSSGNSGGTSNPAGPGPGSGFPGSGPGGSAAGPGGSGGSTGAAASGGATVSEAGASAPAGAGNPSSYAGVKPAASIEFWTDHPGGSAAWEAQLVKAYNSSQSETTVTLVTAGQNYADIAQRFQTALAADKVPALVMGGAAWWLSYVLNGAIVPIEPLAAAVGLDTSDYVTTFFDDYEYRGQHWAIPYARSTPLFYYNKEHFRSAGLPDRAPKTWDEMADFAAKLQKADLGTQAVYNWATPVGYLSWLYENKLWGWGGEYSDKWDLSPMVGKDMITSLQWSARTMKSRGGWAGMTSNSQTNDLAAGVISACVDSTGAIGHLTADTHFDVGAGFLPGGPKATDHVCPTGGTGVSISKRSGPAQQLAAIKFLRYLTNPKNTVSFSEITGYIPVRKSADTTKLVKKTPLVQVSIDQLDHLRTQSWAEVFITGGVQEIGNGIGKVLLKGADPKTAMQGVQQQLQQTYDRDIKPRLHHS